MPTYNSRETKAFHRGINWTRVAVAVAVPVAVAILLGAWSSLETKASHDADIAAVKAAHDVDIAIIKELQQRTLDASCIGHADQRVCKP